MIEILRYTIMVLAIILLHLAPFMFFGKFIQTFIYGAIGLIVISYIYLMSTIFLKIFS